MLEAIVLAGGFGTRLRQVVSDRPKPMAPVAGRPFLEIVLTSLASKGFGRVILSLGFMADKIVSHFGCQFAGMEIAYEIENTPLGTGGALRQALLCCNADHVFVFNGDTYLDLEVSDVEENWQARHAPIVVARAVQDTARYGRLEIAGDRIINFAEKGIAGPGLINAGCYVLPSSILDRFALGRPFSLEAEFMTEAVCTQRFDVFVTNGYFIDIGVPDDYILAQTELA